MTAQAPRRNMGGQAAFCTMGEGGGPVARPRRTIDDAALRQALQRFVTGRLRHREDGEDIVQETYVRFCDYRQTRSVADVGSFCFAIARNLLHDHFRRRAALPPTDELNENIACPLPRAEEALDYHQRVEILVRAFKVMPPLRREIFLRRRLDGTSVAAIASALDMTPAAIEKHCTRALTGLKSALVRRGFPPGAAR